MVSLTDRHLALSARLYLDRNSRAVCCLIAIRFFSPYLRIFWRPRSAVGLVLAVPLWPFFPSVSSFAEPNNPSWAPLFICGGSLSGGLVLGCASHVMCYQSRTSLCRLAASVVLGRAMYCPPLISSFATPNDLSSESYLAVPAVSLVPGWSRSDAGATLTLGRADRDPLFSLSLAVLANTFHQPCAWHWLQSTTGLVDHGPCRPPVTIRHWPRHWPRRPCSAGGLVIRRTRQPTVDGVLGRAGPLTALSLASYDPPWASPFTALATIHYGTSPVLLSDISPSACFILG